MSVGGARERPPTLHPVRSRTLYVAPVRLALAVVWLVAARLAGAGSTPALLAFATAAAGIVFLLFNDPRAAFRSGVDARPVPEGAVVASPLRQALQAMLPSTVGVSVLAAIALSFEPVLAAFLGGVCAGLGLGGVAAVVRLDPGLLVDPRSGALYRAGD